MFLLISFGYLIPFCVSENHLIADGLIMNDYSHAPVTEKSQFGHGS